MDFYAYVELLHVFLKLIAVYLLFITGFDKLIIYSILMLSVSLIVTVIYRIYCMRSFQESRTKPALHKGTCKPMITFSVWALYGDACYSLRQQGTNILLNMFFGPIVNAASTIATTVLSITSGFAQNIITAFKPQIIKAYAIQDFARFNTLIASAAKFALLLLAMLVIILSFEMDLDNLFSQMTNKRYVYVLKKLMIEGMEPSELAKEMEVTVDNLYNIKRRAMKELTHVALKDIDIYVNVYKSNN